MINSSVNINILYAFAISIFGTIIFEMIAKQINLKSIHNRSFSKTLVSSCASTISGYLGVLSCRRANKIFLHQFFSMFTIMASGIIAVYFLLSPKNWSGNASVEYISTIFMVMTLSLVLFFYKKNYSKNLDVGITNLILVFILIYLNLILAMDYRGLVVENWMNIFGMGISLLLITYAVKQIILSQKDTVSSFFVNYYLFILTFVITAFYMERINIKLFQHESIEILLVSVIVLNLISHLLSEQIVENQLVKNKFVSQGIFRFAISFLVIRMVFWII